MVLPVYKVLSLVIRVFSRPLINYVKNAHIKDNGESGHPRLRASFIWLGNASSRWESWVNRRFMKIDSQFAYKPLNDELAIEKGIQFFYEILFYSLMIGLPLYQMLRASWQADQKAEKLDQRLNNIDQNITHMNKWIQDVQTKLQQKQKDKNKEQTGIKVNFYSSRIRMDDWLWVNKKHQDLG